MTHIPTGICVVSQQERSQIQNRKDAMSRLQERVNNYYIELQQKDLLKTIQNQVKSGSRNEKIRTYDYPANTIFDHNSNLSIKRLNDLFGNSQKFFFFLKQNILKIEKIKLNLVL